MDNDSIRAFGEHLLSTTLEPGDTDQNGNQYADIDAYNVEMDRQANTATVSKEDAPF